MEQHTHTHPFSSPSSGTTRVSRYQKDKTNLDFTKAGDSEWQWHQLGHMQVCTSLETDNRASNPALSFFTGWMPFLPPKQQRESTEGTAHLVQMISSTYICTFSSIYHSSMDSSSQDHKISVIILLHTVILDGSYDRGGVYLVRLHDHVICCSGW